MTNLLSFLTIERLLSFVLLLAVVYSYRELQSYKERLKSSEESLRRSLLSSAQKSFGEIINNFTELLTLFDSLDELGVPRVNTDSFFEKIRSIQGTETTPMSDLYASKGGNRAWTEAQSDALQSDSQKSSVQNDFSTFRRHWVEGGPSRFDVNHWIPNDAVLEQLVLEKLFNNDAGAFETWIKYAGQLRDQCLRFLSYARFPTKIPEMTYQSLFIMVFAELLRELPCDKWNILPVNKLKLQVELAINRDSNPGQFIKTILSGFPDVGVFPNNQSFENAMLMKVTGEFKKFLRAFTEFHSKDQMLIELMACRQLNPERDYVKGFLTDIFALNIALQSKDGSFYVATRVCDNRTFFIRLLFLLIDLSEEDFEDLVLSRVEVRESIKQDEKGPAGINQSKVPTQSGRGTSQRKRRKNKGKQKSVVVDNAPYVIDFKADEEVEHFETLFNEHYIWAYRLYGKSYLCEESLRQVGCPENGKGNLNQL